ncbi:MAG: DUF222 domain-containing protein [Candidatus Dormibacteria bacterium]
MLTGRESPDLVAFQAVVAAYCERDLATAPAGDVSVDLEVKRALINLLEVDFARDAARFAATYDEAVFGNPHPVAWLRECCHMTSHAAATAICVGEQAGRLDRSEAAVADGRLGFAHLGLMASTAQALDEAGASVRFNEERLIARAQVLSVKRFRTLCAHVRHEADREAFLAASLARREWRTLELTPCGEDGVSISGFLDPEGGALLRAALEPLAVKGGAEDVRPREQRCADALVELCAHALDSGAVPQRASQRAHVQVTTSLETLLDLVGAPAGEMEFAGTIAGATVQRIACDSTITRVLLDPASQAVDLGRSERVVSGATRRALNIRDAGCRWPGCERPSSWTAAHHVVHWTHGGPTNLDNLVLLCRRHHWSVHEGGWRLVRARDGALLVAPPGGGPVHHTRAPDPCVAA